MTRETSLALRVGVPVGAGALLLVAGYLLYPRSHPKAPPPLPAEPECRLIEQPKPLPTTDTYDRLAVCLEQWNANRQVGVKAISVADVRYWVEVEHDPTWLDNRMWWLPLSGEGEEHFPSGLYIGVPTDGTVCNFSIVN